MEFSGDIGDWQRRIADSPEGNLRRLAVFEALSPQAGARVLDAGCGGGHLVRELARAVGADGRAVGIDLSDDQLAAARTRCAGLHWAELIEADVSATGFDDAVFDGVSSIQVLEYVPNVDAALAEIRRVMKPGGRAAFVSVLWDAFQFHGADLALTVRIMDAWRSHCPHQMLPTEMPRRMAEAGMGGAVQRPLAFFNGTLHEHCYAYWAAKVVAAYAVGTGVGEADARDWLDQLGAADRAGRFGFVSVPVLTVGTAI